jgi:hypothetical protein
MACSFLHGLLLTYMTCFLLAAGWHISSCCHTGPAILS